MTKLKAKFLESLKYYDQNINELNDDIIINMFYNNNRLIRNSTILVKQYKNVYNYFLTRYTDGGTDIKEILYRIVHKIETYPLCECGNKLKFMSINFGYTNFCCAHCAGISKTTIEKIENTKLQRYGDKHYNNSKKQVQTCLLKYGVTTTLQLDSTKQKSKETCLKKYGVTHPWKNKDVQNKIKQTCLSRYGVENPFASNIIKQKIKQTCIERYGVDNPTKNKEILNKCNNTKLRKYGDKHYNNHEKYIQTCIDRYGVENPMKLKEYQDKAKETNIEKLGVPYTAQNSLCMQKLRNTCLQKYGVDHYTKTDEYKKWNSMHMSLPEIQDKINNTKKKHKSFNTSNIEQLLKEYFVNENIQYMYQYKSEKYPFNCDFYLPKYELFIEIQGMWTHGKHPFDENNMDDINLKNKWLQKNNDFYNDAINVWTKTDVYKRNIAIQNKLNYLEIFSTNIDICVNEIQTKINSLNII